MDIESKLDSYEALIERIKPILADGGEMRDIWYFRHVPLFVWVALVAAAGVVVLLALIHH